MTLNNMTLGITLKFNTQHKKSVIIAASSAIMLSVILFEKLSIAMLNVILLRVVTPRIVSSCANTANTLSYKVPIHVF